MGVPGTRPHRTLVAQVGPWAFGNGALRKYFAYSTLILDDCRQREVRTLMSLNADTWEQVLVQVRGAIGDKRFNLWFRNTRFVSADSQQLQIGVPNLFIKGWMEENFSETVRESARKTCDWQGHVVFTVAGDLFREMRSQQLAASVDDISSHGKEPGRDMTVSEPKRTLTLDDFVVGPCNQLAHASATEICFHSEPAFTRLFLHGGVGLGKTHLLQGIWSKLRATSDDGQAVYATAEKWTNQYVYALKSNQLEAFRKKFRSVRTFLIDDVHFLKNKRGIQEEFLHTFDAIDGSNKRIVIASDSHPRDLREITQSLATRFMSGMMAKLGAPDFDTRVRILVKKTQDKKHRFSQDVIEFMADRITNNVRELEGAVTTVVAYASLAQKPISTELASDALSEIDRATGPVVTVKEIEDEVTGLVGFTRADLHSKRRTRSISRARHVCMYLARQFTRRSCRDIGHYFGGMKHSTVISACKNVKERMGNDEELASLVAKVTSKLQR